MPGLSAKVFRTYNASETLQNELPKAEDLEGMHVQDKVGVRLAGAVMSMIGLGIGAEAGVDRGELGMQGWSLMWVRGALSGPGGGVQRGEPQSGHSLQPPADRHQGHGYLPPEPRREGTHVRVARKSGVRARSTSF